MGLGIDDIMAMGRHTSARTSRLYVFEQDRRRERGVAALGMAIRFQARPKPNRGEGGF